MKPPDVNLHIHAPELMTGTERARDKIITAVMWAFYVYLWVPLISLFAWLLGFEFAYDVMIRTGGARELGSILLVYTVIIVAIFFTVAIWSLGNLVRYGKMHRRKAKTPVATAEMAEYFGVDEAGVNQLRERRSISIEFDAEGRPLIGTTRPEIQALPADVAQ